MRAAFRRGTLVNLQGLEQQRLRGNEWCRSVSGPESGRHCQGQQSPNTTAALKRATLHAGERWEMELGSALDDSWNIKASYCKSWTKYGNVQAQRLQIGSWGWGLMRIISLKQLCKRLRVDAGVMERLWNTLERGHMGLRGWAAWCLTAGRCLDQTLCPFKKVSEIACSAHVCAAFIWSASEKGSFWSLSLRQTTSQMDGWMDGWVERDREIDKNSNPHYRQL